MIFKTEKLCKSFGNKEVLKNISFEISKKEIFAIIGPSGAGKTTLLRILNFFEKPTKGSIMFYRNKINYDSHEIHKFRLKMSMIFQNTSIFKTTVYNNVAFGLKVRKIDKKLMHKKVINVLDMVGLSGKEKQHASTLSGGEKQRMAFARAIIYEPEILILDEPTANLDPVNVKKIEDIIKYVNQEYNTTIIIATHNINQVQRIAHKVGVLLNGEMIEINTKENIFKNPKDKRTYAFIKGEMVY